MSLPTQESLLTSGDMFHGDAFLDGDVSAAQDTLTNGYLFHGTAFIAAASATVFPAYRMFIVF